MSAFRKSTLLLKILHLLFSLVDIFVSLKIVTVQSSLSKGRVVSSYLAVGCMEARIAHVCRINP